MRCHLSWVVSERQIAVARGFAPSCARFGLLGQKVRGGAVLTEGFGRLDETAITRALADAPQLTLAPVPGSARTARDFVRAQTGIASADLREDAELLASELVTNSVVHGRTAMVLAVLARPRSVLIGVSDRSTGLPTERPAALMAEGGRGLSLVSLLARHWGVSVRDSGKIIWCLIDAAPFTR